MDDATAPRRSDEEVTRTYVRPEPPAQPAAEPLPAALADHPDYEIKRELGRGGMGIVYLAHNTLLGRDEVLKVIGRQVMHSPDALERFLREIRAVARLRHPNIVTAYSATRRGEGIVFAMELVDGLDLSKLVKAKGPLPIAHACHFVYQAALGLQHAHENGLVHRDIKPGNLMISRAGDRATLKILDFGLAKLNREAGQLTADGHALGTPNYMAPEQLVDAQSAEIRADIFSLGATLHFLLTGRPPFQGKLLSEIYRAHTDWTPERLKQARPDVPPALVAVVETMMAKDPAERYATPQDVAEALSPFFKKGNQASTKASVAAPAVEPPATERAMSSTVPESGWEGLIVFGQEELSTAEEAQDATTGAPAWLWPSVAGLLLVAVLALAAGLFVARRQAEPEPGEALADQAADVSIQLPKTQQLGTPPEPAPEESNTVRTPPPAETPEVKTADETKAQAASVASQSAPNAPEQGRAADRETSPAQAVPPSFNGTSLTGFVPGSGRPGDWRIQEGSLSFQGLQGRALTPGLKLTPDQSKRLSFSARSERSNVLFTARSYLDFALKLEFRATGNGNSGIVLADLDRGDQLPRYAEIALGLSDRPGWRAGDFLSWNFAWPEPVVPARSVRLNRDGWNTLELESHGGALRLSVNGRLVEHDKPLTLSGPRRIGLRGMSADVRFRNIEVRGEPVRAEGGDGKPGLFLGDVIYVDDLSDPSTGWGKEETRHTGRDESFTRNYEDGVYFLQLPRNWTGTTAWNAWGPLAQDFQFEAVGRVLGEDPLSTGTWTLVLTGRDRRGIQVSIDRLGQVLIEPAFWGVDDYPNDPRFGPFRHPAVRPGGEWNEVTLRVRNRRVDVLINSGRVCEPLNLDWDLLPATPQIAASKPDSEPRIRAEFDFMEIRQLRPETH